MSLMRSPNSGKSCGSGSFPDLRNIHTEEEFSTRRKRKQPDDKDELKKQLSDFRIEIMGFLQNFSKTQTENTDKIYQEMTAIKDEIRNLKQSNDRLASEQQKITIELEDMKTQNSAMKEKLKLLENDFSQLKSQNNSNHKGDNELSNLTYTNVVLELQERMKRQYSIIVVGVAEINEKNVTKRREYDVNETYGFLKTIYKECPIPIQTIRLGRYNPNKNRHLKVSFGDQDTVKNILRKKQTATTNEIKIYPDQTPMQYKQLSELRKELSQRIADGETNLTIKYVKGIPQIVQTVPKNFNREMRANHMSPQ